MQLIDSGDYGPICSKGSQLQNLIVYYSDDNRDKLKYLVKASLNAQFYAEFKGYATIEEFLKNHVESIYKDILFKNKNCLQNSPKNVSK